MQDAEIVMSQDQEFTLGATRVNNPAWTLEKLHQACGGEILPGSGNILDEFQSVSTDSRTIQPGDIFLALKGNNFDGANYIHTAIERGAACVICEKKPDSPVSTPCIIVADSLYALGELARYRRAILKNITVIGLTGSSGKTSVKEMTASILEQRARVIKTKGNFNNLIGLPLSLLPANFNHEFALLEMGMNRPGEIARLTEIANPDIACILNVHDAHIAGLGSIEGVAMAKGELFQGCSANAKIIVNLDDERVAALGEKFRGEKITFGLHKKAFVRGTHIENKGFGGMEFTLHIGAEKGRVSVKALGLHNVCNCLAAAAISHAAGADFKDIVQGLTNLEPPQKRLEISTDPRGLILVNDSYNANPASMRAAIETVSSMKNGVKTVAVLGDMLELGNMSSTAHLEIGALVAKRDFDYLLAFGEHAETMAGAAKENGMNERQIFSFSSKESLTEKLDAILSEKILQKGDLLLFKGSRGMQMETFIEHLMAEESRSS